MKGNLIALLAVCASLPAIAQQSAPAPSDASKPVAVINGQVITAETLDQLYDRLGMQMRDQYEKTGGKAAFLENYLRKRLIIQEALKSGFDKRPDVQADMEVARESTLFDRYVRDVISRPIVTDAAIHEYYDAHKNEFTTPERVKVRHLVIGVSNAGPHPRTKEQALEIMQKIASDLHTYNVSIRSTDTAVAAHNRIAYFGELARQHSDDASAQSGGDLGWVTRGMLDPDFEAAAFALAPTVPSGIVQTRFGYHLIMVEAKQPAGIQTFDETKSKIREYLMAQHAAEVVETVTKLTNELRSSSKIAIYPENIK